MHKLPAENRALVSNLSRFLIEIVDNQDLNKMNIRNIAIVFGPTLNIPGPIITAFLTDYDAIFGAKLEDEQASPIRETLMHTPQQGSEWDGIRSPRHQMFTDLPTPAYNQTGFQNIGGFAPVQQGPAPRRSHQPQYLPQQQAMGGFPHPDYQQQQQQYMTQQPQQDGFSSLNAALGPPPPPPQQQQQQQPQGDERQLRKAKRESNMQMLNYASGGGGGGGSLAEMLHQQRKPNHQMLGDGRDGTRDSPARQF